MKHVKLYFAANDITERQVLIFLSVIGAKTYSLLGDLLALTNPKEKSFNELAKVLKKQFEPKPLVIAERFTFHRRNQLSTRSVLDYVAELRCLGMHCEFGDYLDQALRDRLVCGIRSENIQKCLLIKAGLTLTRMVELAQGMEAAHQNTRQQAQSVRLPMNRDQQTPVTNQSITRGSNAIAVGSKESAHLKVVRKCHKCGHFAKICLTKGVNLTKCIETDQSAHVDDFIFKVDNRVLQPYQSKQASCGHEN